MFRTSGLNAHVVDRLINEPILLEHDTGSVRIGATELGPDPRKVHRSEDGFAHAVLEFAALSLSAGSVLALRS